MRKITIELSPESCNRAIEELKAYKKHIKPKLDEVCRRLCEIGIAEARAHLTLAHGNTDASLLEPVKTANGYKIVMQGSDVYFVEFGTGDAASNPSYAVSVPVYPGSYSEGNAKKYSTYGFWWYGGERLTETPAYMPMYHAAKRMRQEVKRVVREVFSQ